jgi:NTP pyrophosphatase (non-canonical NTP hydrolase)
VSLSDYQKEVDDWLQGYKVPYWEQLSQLARLMEEVGELSRVYNHAYGGKVKKATEEPDDLEGELGDILFTVICLANSDKIDLDEALKKVIIKAKTRDRDRYERKEV